MLLWVLVLPGAAIGVRLGSVGSVITFAGSGGRAHDTVSTIGRTRELAMTRIFMTASPGDRCQYAPRRESASRRPSSVAGLRTAQRREHGQIRRIARSDQSWVRRSSPRSAHERNARLKLENCDE